jgi:hypothetical protein
MGGDLSSAGEIQQVLPRTAQEVGCACGIDEMFWLLVLGSSVVYAVEIEMRFKAVHKKHSLAMQQNLTSPRGNKPPLLNLTSALAC